MESQSQKRKQLNELSTYSHWRPSKLWAGALSVVWGVADKHVQWAEWTYDDTEVVISVSVCCFCLLFTCWHRVGQNKEEKLLLILTKSLLDACLSQCFLSDGLQIKTTRDRILPKVYQQQTAAQLHHNLQWKLETVSGNLHNTEWLPFCTSFFFFFQSCSIPALSQLHS